MNSTATLSEVARAHLDATRAGRWRDAHVLLAWLADVEAGRPVYHCFRPGCPELLPHDYADAFCSSACADLYALTQARPTSITRTPADRAYQRHLAREIADGIADRLRLRAGRADRTRGRVAVPW